MKTKEDILYNHLDYRWANDNLNVDDLLNAMEEYAQQQKRLFTIPYDIKNVSNQRELLIAFADYLDENYGEEDERFACELVDEFIKERNL